MATYQMTKHHLTDRFFLRHRNKLRHHLVGNWCGGELKDGDIQRATQKKAELKVKAILPITGLARTMLFK